MKLPTNYLPKYRQNARLIRRLHRLKGLLSRYSETHRLYTEWKQEFYFFTEKRFYFPEVQEFKKQITA